MNIHHMVLRGAALSLAVLGLSALGPVAYASTVDKVEAEALTVTPGKGGLAATTDPATSGAEGRAFEIWSSGAVYLPATSTGLQAITVRARATGPGGDSTYTVKVDGVAVSGGVAQDEASALRAAIAAVDICGIGVTGSFGVAGTSPGKPFVFDDLLARADGALYEAKRAGRNRVAVASASLSVVAQAAA